MKEGQGQALPLPHPRRGGVHPRPIKIIAQLKLSPNQSCANKDHEAARSSGVVTRSGAMR